jgi:hypothetical protein
VLSTIIVPNRNSWRQCRAKAALERKHGLKLLTIDQLAARLAGGFLQPIDPDNLSKAVKESIGLGLGDLDAIKTLPGFQRAAANSLSKAWSAGLSLESEAKAAVDPAARVRLEALALLEQEVLARLPKNELRPNDLVARALGRIVFARVLFGSIEVQGRTEMSPVWRPLLAALAAEIEVNWVAEARRVPPWLANMGVKALENVPEQPARHAISCASPRHEILEAVRWARGLLAKGVGAHEIAIATASPAGWDDHVLALAATANIPIHFIHGRAALDSAEGQLAAALAEVLLRGFSQPRLKRTVGLLRAQTTKFSSLPSQWWRKLPEDAPLLNAERWKNEIAALDPEDYPDSGDPSPLLLDIIDAIGLGLAKASEIGELLLQGKALAIWRKALTDAPAEALDVTLAGLRVDDGLEPTVSVVWGPAAAIAAVPRPYTWLVGLTSRSWPRRANEDPLLPHHVVPSSRLDPLPVHQADTRDFETIGAMTARELLFSRARRDSGGRVNGVSPLYPRDIAEVYLAQSREPEQAASDTDRLFARPAEFSALPEARAALSAWIDWHTERITAHDGSVRANHPLLLQALDRRQSASSLSKLLRDPLGYLWQYGFGWSSPDEVDEPLTLNPLQFGNLLHEILEAAILILEEKPGGFAAAAQDELALQNVIAAAAATVAARWEATAPVPPPVIWRRKCEDVSGLALTALSAKEAPLAGQESFAEIPFGGDSRAVKMGDNVLATLPWDPRTPVIIPGTSIAIGGSIDRLDIAGDNSAARVTDYKSGKFPRGVPQLKGGAELQRCLYAYAVRSLIAGSPEVEARLLYPRKNGAPLNLASPDETLAKLTTFLTAAYSAFAAGKALPGPGAAEEFNDFAFALPGGAKESYLELIRPLVAAELADVAPLWDEP